MSLEKYESTIQACLACAVRCESCASYCLTEHEIQTMTRCMELTKNCAAISILTARFLASGSEFVTQVCDLCADICEACAEECDRHYMDHCKDCYHACLECAEECRKISLEYV
jgi:hypothetical protein